MLEQRGRSEDSPTPIRGAAPITVLRTAFRVLRAQRLWRLPFLVLHRAAWYLLRRIFGPRHFELAGSRHAYFVHPFVLDNERAVEIPLALAAIRDHGGRRRLEVGNVLSAFVRSAEADGGARASADELVIDKYEEAPGTLAIDILEHHPAEPYDLVLSISTLEHIGRDESPRELTKALRALEHLRSMVAPGGYLLATFPIGWNEALDRALADDRLDAYHPLCLERRGRWNRWQECRRSEALARSYDDPYPAANAVIVLSWQAPPA